MHDNIGIIKEEPTGIRASFAVMRQNAIMLDSLFNFLADSACLADIITVADDEVVRETA